MIIFRRIKMIFEMIFTAIALLFIVGIIWIHKIAGIVILTAVLLLYCYAKQKRNSKIPTPNIRFR